MNTVNLSVFSHFSNKRSKGVKCSIWNEGEVCVDKLDYS